MYLYSENRPGAHNKGAEKFRTIIKKDTEWLNYLKNKNISHGGEFIDDAIRTKEQPFPNTGSTDDKSKESK